jgi:hypothetical protein
MFEAFEDTTLQYDPLENAAERIAQTSLGFLNGDLSADDEDMAPDLVVSEEEGSSRNLLHILFILSTTKILVNTPGMNEDDHDDLPRKRARNHTSDRATAREWYPWQDRIVSSALPFFF